MNQLVRAFETGATRSADAGRYDPEGFLSPIVIERYCEYMQKHRVQPDGSVRASDNWQKGLSPESYMKGLQRHNLHAWARFRGFSVVDPGAAADLEEDLCAIIFNAQGLLFELLKHRRAADKPTFAPDGWKNERPRDLKPFLQDVQRSLEAAPFPTIAGFPLEGGTLQAGRAVPLSDATHAAGQTAAVGVGYPPAAATLGEVTLRDVIRKSDSEGGSPD